LNGRRCGYLADFILFEDKTFFTAFGFGEVLIVDDVTIWQILFNLKSGFKYGGVYLVL